MAKRSKYPKRKLRKFKNSNQLELFIGMTGNIVQPHMFDNTRDKVFKPVDNGLIDHMHNELIAESFGWPMMYCPVIERSCAMSSRDDKDNYVCVEQNKLVKLIDNCSEWKKESKSRGLNKFTSNQVLTFIQVKIKMNK